MNQPVILKTKPYLFYTIALVTLLIVSVLALGLGATPIAWSELWSWMLRQNVDSHHALILDNVRCPRWLAAAACGAFLAISGALMQVWSSNGLAGPGLLGLNGGASAVLALAITYYPMLSTDIMMGLSMGGATLGGALVLGFVRIIPAGHEPGRLVLIGMTVSAFLASATTSVVIANGMQNDLLYWTIGGLGTVGWREVQGLVLAGILATILMASSKDAIAVLNIGENAAKTLGVHRGWLYLSLTVSIILLTGSANAVAGPIGFIGFLSPHIARYFLGSDPRSILPGAAIVGAILTIFSDTIGRVVSPPEEQPLGLFLAFIGTPSLIWVAVKMSKRST